MPNRPFAVSIVKQLQEKGYEAFFAGGWVRDFLLHHPSDDIDIATNAPIEVVQKLFPKTIPVGIAFGIVIVVEGGHPFEVATFRKDRGYLDGRRPTGIEPATAKEDAQRRDFTINGLFYDPVAQKLYDYVDGQKDLKKGIIRAIGNPHERFLEDRLRMMRAIRYATRFDFTIDEETSLAIRAHAAQLLPSVAIERVWQEFKKLSRFAHFDKALVSLHELGLLGTIFPVLKELPSEVIAERVRCMESFPKEAPVIAELLELFPGSSLDELLALSDYLKLPRQDRDFIAFYHHAHSLFDLPNDWQKELEPYEWALFYADERAELSLGIIASHVDAVKRAAFLKGHEQRRHLLEKAIRRIRLQDPLIRSSDLMSRGVVPGKEMGRLLKEAERISVNEGIEEREALLDRLLLP